MAVDERPVTRYARAPDGVSLAYQVTGDGPLDLVLWPGFSYLTDLLWEDLGFRHIARRLGGFSRTIWHEPRGVGASGGDFFGRMSSLSYVG
jgi:hypothetical protein